ncbi:MAG: S8 family serine peptidase [Verrucomicrobiota bacterium]
MKRLVWAAVCLAVLAGGPILFHWFLDADGDSAFGRLGMQGEAERPFLQNQQTDGRGKVVRAGGVRSEPPPGGSPAWKDSVAASLLSDRWDLGNPKERAELGRRLRAASYAEWQYTRETAERMGLELRTPDGAVLVGFEGEVPIYEMDENVNAAISVNAHLVRETAPYSVDGDSWTMGIWEVSGIPRLTHTEFSGRVSVGDGTSEMSDHATHVAGILFAEGVNAAVKGMAPGASLVAHSSTDDTVEMALLAMAVANESGRIPVSNHSYGQRAGWVNTSWYGVFSDDGNAANDFVERFGRYTSTSAAWDGIMWNAPYYLAFKSAGNNRNDEAPGALTRWRLNGSVFPILFYDLSAHPGDDSSYRISGGHEGFDTLTQKSVPKNGITVGSVLDAVSSGNRALSGAILNSFTGFGPTDDGRIKPDLVANGNGLVSTGASSDADTSNRTGTSMAAPGACGAAVLMVDYFARLFPGQGMLGSTLKALLLHTADDLGNVGPDYRYGWGLVNVLAAADLVLGHQSELSRGRMIEGKLGGAVSFQSYPVYYEGLGPLRVTLCWTDPPGAATTAHDVREARLVHDLNIRVESPSAQLFRPWVMPWVGTYTDANLDASATTGINTVDNVEQIFLEAPPEAGVYTLTVDFAGGLVQGPQTYSLIVTGGSFPRGYELWAAQEYPGEWANVLVSGFGADLEGDGLANGIEYAFDLDAGGYDGLNSVYTAGEENVGSAEYMTLVYERDTSKSDIGYIAEWSSDFVTWTPLDGVVIGTEGTRETVKVMMENDGRRKFARLRIVRL